MRSILKGSVDQSVVVRIVDSTDGTPEEAVEHNTSGISLWYRREGGSVTAITPASLAAANSTHADGGIEHLDDGYYRIDLPDAAVASGANGVMIGGTVTGMVVIGCYVPLVDWNPYDGVRGGMTALPNAAAAANGGLATVDGSNAVKVQSGTGANQINLSSGNLAGSVASVVGNVGGNVVGSVASVTANVTIADGHLTSAKFADGFLTNAKIGANAISDAKVDPDVTIASVTGAVGSVTGNVGGNVSGSIGSVAAGGISASSFAASAIDTTALATSAAAEIASSVRAELATELSQIDASVSSRLATAGYTAPDNATISSISSAVSSLASSLSTVGTNVTTALNRLGSFTGSGVNTVLGFFLALMKSDATTPSDVGGTFAASTDALQAIRDNMGTQQTGDAYARLGAPAGASHAADVAAIKAETAAIVADTNELQTDWADGGRLDLILDARASATALATLQTTANTIDDFLDTEIAAIKTVTDKLNTGLEADGASGYQWTTLSLENAPAGGGGGTTDWTATERSQIRKRLGIDGATEAPAATPDLFLASGYTAPANAAILAAIVTVDDYVDAEIAAIKVVTDRVGTMLEDAGGSVWRFTEGSLINAPLGEGGSGGGLTEADVQNAISSIDVDGVEFLSAFRCVCAAMIGKNAGGFQADQLFYGLDGSTVRIRAVVDTQGNRNSVQLTV